MVTGLKDPQSGELIRFEGLTPFEADGGGSGERSKVMSGN